MSQSVQDEIRLVSNQLEHLFERQQDREEERRHRTIKALCYLTYAICITFAYCFPWTPKSKITELVQHQLDKALES